MKTLWTSTIRRATVLVNDRLTEAAIATKPHLSRRALIRGAGATALAAGIGMPATCRAQSGIIRIGHLTPRTGYRAPLGDHAVMGIELAAEEINAAGGVDRRPIELLLEDSADPLIGTARAERMVERDAVAMLIGEIPQPDTAIARIAERYRAVFINTGVNDSIPAAPRNRYVFHVQTMNAPIVGDFIERFTRRYGKPPEWRSWSDYCALKIGVRLILS